MDFSNTWSFFHTFFSVLHKFGGLAAVISQLDNIEPDVRKLAAWVLGKASQNNPVVQDQVRESSLSSCMTLYFQATALCIGYYSISNLIGLDLQFHIEMYLHRFVDSNLLWTSAIMGKFYAFICLIILHAFLGVRFWYTGKAHEDGEIWCCGRGLQSIACSFCHNQKQFKWPENILCRSWRLDA